MAKRAESSSDESSNISDATFRHFLGCYANVSVFLREIKELPRIS